MNTTTAQREQNKIFNYKEREQGASIITSMPLVAKIEVTTRCNLACRMCATRFSDKERVDLSFDTFMKLQPVFPYLLSAYLYGIGEPLLHPDLSKMIDVLSDAGVNVGLITNGALITREMAEEWVQKGLYKLSVSIDGSTKDTYEMIRRGSSFDTVMENMTVIRDLKKRYNTDRPYVTFNFVAMKSTISELVQMIEMASEYDACEVIVSDLQVFDESMRDEKLSFTDPVLQDSFAAAEKKAAERGVTLVLPHTFLLWRTKNENNAFSRSYEKLHKSTTPIFESFAACTEPWSSFWFTQEGDITPCCYWFRKMGNVNNDDFEVIWNNKQYQSLRVEVNSSSRSPHCRTCPIP